VCIYDIESDINIVALLKKGIYCRSIVSSSNGTTMKQDTTKMIRLETAFSVGGKDREKSARIVF
jgi:hypothetical protein